jgi:hypothetical protein
VPDHTDEREHTDQMYVATIDKSIGCHSHVTGSHYDSRDWVLDTECQLDNVVHGTMVVAHLRVEGIGEQLRREGFTQLLTYIQHSPYGTSELTPAAEDNYVLDGLQWYVDTRWLESPIPEVTLTYGIPVSEGVAFLAGAGIFVVGALSGAYWSTLQTLPFSLAYWAAWLVLSVGFRGLAIAGILSGGEGLVADLRALCWYGALALLLRTCAEVLITTRELRRPAAPVPVSWVWQVSFWRVLAECPFAMALVLLCDRSKPINLPSVVVMFGLSGVLALGARYALTIAEGVKGAKVTTGELHDAVFDLARRLSVPLRSLYVLPAGATPRVVPKVDPSGRLMIPERLLSAASRREIDGMVGYELILIRTRSWRSIWLAIFPVIVSVVYRAYSFQSRSTAVFGLVVEAGIVASAFVAFKKSLRSAHRKAEKALLKSGGDPEGWIAGLGRIAKLADTTVDRAMQNGIAERCGVSPERAADLLSSGLSAEDRYPIPFFDNTNLVPVSLFGMGLPIQARMFR